MGKSCVLQSEPDIERDDWVEAKGFVHAILSVVCISRGMGVDGWMDGIGHTCKYFMDLRSEYSGLLCIPMVFLISCRSFVTISGCVDNS